MTQMAGDGTGGRRGRFPDYCLEEETVEHVRSELCDGTGAREEEDFIVSVS